jgi:hypothetical protein
MRELSIEEKAKAYDEALKRASNLYKDAVEMENNMTTKTCEIIFPELSESEDERIRKDIIFYIKAIANNENISPDSKKECKTWIAWLEKQGREKPADKVGTKFKVGDWITDDEDEAIFHITSYDIDYGYQLETVNGTSFHYSDETIEKKYRLWTIQDAKAGDVLFMDNGSANCIFIYKSSNNGIINKYASYNKFGFEGEHYLVLNDGYVIPTTKEQRDLLFQKMKEAGYEWDTDKLQLTKTLPVKELSDGINIDKQKSAWSEEDEKCYTFILSTIEEKYGNEGDVYNWLKSLRQRCAWKPSIAQLNALSIVSKGNAPDDIEAIVSLYNDLKKLTE